MRARQARREARQSDRRRQTRSSTASSTALPARRLADRLGHPDEHERQRGDRQPGDRAGSAARSAARTRSTPTTTSTTASPPTTPSRPRCTSPRRGPCRTAPPGLEHMLAALEAKAKAVGRHREDRPHAPAGRDAADARPGVQRLRAADGTGLAPHRDCARRRGELAQGGTAVGTGSTPGRASPRRSPTRWPHHRPAAFARPRTSSRPWRPRRAGRASTAPQHAGRRSCSRSPTTSAARQRPALRHRRADPAGKRAGLVDHARQGQPDPGEALTMVCAQVMGNQTTVTIAASQGTSSSTSSSR
jgi:hypothetical protein